jgi:hypothetical protein
MVHGNRSVVLGALAVASLLHSAPASAQCAELNPVRVSTSRVNIGSTSLRLFQGMIGVQPAVTGPGMFFNLNQGDRAGYVRLIFRGTAPVTGTARVTRNPLHINAGWALSGDYLYQAPNGRPDSSLALRAAVTLAIAGGAPSTLASRSLLSVRTYDQGLSGQLHQDVALSPATSYFRVGAGQQVDYVIGLEIDSYSSAKGTAALTVSEFALLENYDHMRMCVTADPEEPEPEPEPDPEPID